MGRFGAVFGPCLGGQLLAAGEGDRGFTAFALAGVSSMVSIGVAALRPARHAAPAAPGRSRPPPADTPGPCGAVQ